MIQACRAFVISRGGAGIAAAAALLAGVALSAGCSASGKTKDRETAPPPVVAVAPAAAIERPIARYGRVVATPIERGTPVTPGAELIRLSAIETDAQMKEAEANAAQIEARLGLTPGTAVDVNAVPEVQNAKASYDLAQSEFNRIKALL